LPDASRISSVIFRTSDSASAFFTSAVAPAEVARPASLFAVRLSLVASLLFSEVFSQ